MILSARNTTDAVRLHSCLKNKSCAIIKNNVVFCEGNVDIGEYQHAGSILVRNMDDYLYEELTDGLIALQSVSVTTMEARKNFSREDLPLFRLPDCQFSGSGNHVILFFSSQYINNPLDVLATLALHLEPERAYSSIKMDYIPYKDKLIYYILFSYPRYVHSNFNDILNIKNAVNEIQDMVSNNSIMPESQINFQKEFFSEYEYLESFADLFQEGAVVFSPFMKLEQYQKTIENFAKAFKGVDVYA